MSINEMDSKIKALRELRRMADELAAEIESITDSIKASMEVQGVDTINGTEKKALPDLAAQFTKPTTARRFCIA